MSERRLRAKGQRRRQGGGVGRGGGGDGAEETAEGVVAVGDDPFRREMGEETPLGIVDPALVAGDGAGFDGPLIPDGGHASTERVVPEDDGFGRRSLAIIELCPIVKEPLRGHPAGHVVVDRFGHRAFKADRIGLAAVFIVTELFGPVIFLLLAGGKFSIGSEAEQAATGSARGMSRSVSATLLRKFVKQPSTILATISTMSASLNPASRTAVSCW